MRGALCTSFSGPEGVIIERDIPRPKVGPHDVRVSVAFAALNFMDTLIVSGRYQLKPNLPFVVGHDASGVVLEVGSEVTGLRIGDRVSAGASTGAFAEEMVAPAHRVIKLPEAVDLRAGAAYRASHCSALYALRHRAAIRSGEKLVVTGAAGGVGLAALQIARKLKVPAFGIVRSKAKAAAVEAEGATAVICPNPEDVVAVVGAAVPGGFDVALDVAGGQGLPELVKVAAWEARILVVGFTAGVTAIPANRLLLRSASLVGVNYGAAQDQNLAVTQEIHSSLLAWMASGDVTPRIAKEFPLEELDKAFELMTSGNVSGKILLRVSG